MLLISQDGRVIRLSSNKTFRVKDRIAGISVEGILGAFTDTVRYLVSIPSIGSHGQECVHSLSVFETDPGGRDTMSLFVRDDIDFSISINTNTRIASDEKFSTQVSIE